MTLTVEEISADEYRAHLTTCPASHQQCPSWPQVKQEWGSELLGWRDDGGRLVGAGVLLRRGLPLTGGSIAVLAEGPALDWARYGTAEVLEPLVERERRRGTITLRVGPDVVLHRWSAASVKDRVGSGLVRDLPPDVVDPVGARIVADLAAAGWARAREGDGFYGSTRHAFHLPLSGRTPEDLLAGMNQQWRRAIRKAERAGVVVERGGPDDLAAFHRLYAETGARDGFRPHPPEYFRRMWTALSAEGPGRVRLYLARHDGETLAAMLVVVVAGLASYAYGGSAGHKREVYPSNAAHWRILRDLVEEGAHTYDMRGVADDLDPESPKFGVLRFKLGTGGDVVEDVGDWELPLRPLLHRGVAGGMRALRGLVTARHLVAAVRPSGSGPA